MEIKSQKIRLGTRYSVFIFFVLIGFFILFSILEYFIFTNFKSRQAIFIQNKLDSLTSRIDATNITLANFAHYIFENLIDTEEITALIAKAWDTSEERRSPLRNELYELLESDYDNLLSYNFRQLHFHFPDTTSFLRMHSPEQFGDKLAQVRPTVLKANQTLKPVVGFEEGRIFNGMRYVHPLFHNETHCGSVEISFSMNSFLEVLGGSNHCSKRFAMNRSVVETTVFSINQNLYELTEFSDQLMYDKSVKILGNYVDLSKIFPNINFFLEKNKDFGLEAKHDQAYHLYLFKSIKNINNKPVAWIIYGMHDDGLHQILLDYIQLASSLAIIWLIICIVIFKFSMDRRKLKLISNTDMLTGIANRKNLYEQANLEISKALRYAYPVSLIFFDIDHFKSFNDTYGHAEGDEVLKETTKVVQKVIRKTDIFARWGGEEFIILLPHTKKENAYTLSEKIRETIAEASISKHRKVTISLGITSFILDDTIDTMFSRADKAMYTAKDSGRNCSVLYT